MPIPTGAGWAGAALFAGAFGLWLLNHDVGRHAGVVAMLGTAFEAALEPTPRTRGRIAALATLALGVGAEIVPSEMLQLLACATCGWLAFEMRRPLERSPWPVLATTAFAITQSPLAFGILLASTALSLGRLPPSEAPAAPLTREDELLGAAFFAGVTTMFSFGDPRGPLIAFAVLAMAALRSGRALPLPIHIAVHGAVAAMTFACFAHDFTPQSFAAGCGSALEAIAIVGMAIFLPKNSRYALALTLAGTFFGCGGFLQMMIPHLYLHWIAYIPAAVFVTIALKQANQK